MSRDTKSGRQVYEGAMKASTDALMAADSEIARLRARVEELEWALGKVMVEWDAALERCNCPWSGTNAEMERQYEAIANARRVLGERGSK